MPLPRFRKNKLRKNDEKGVQPEEVQRKEMREYN